MLMIVEKGFGKYAGIYDISRLTPILRLSNSEAKFYHHISLEKENQQRLLIILSVYLSHLRAGLALIKVL